MSWAGCALRVVGEPVHVELELDALGVRPADDPVVARGPTLVLELVAVVVVGESYAGACEVFADDVELVDEQPVGGGTALVLAQ